MNAAPLREGFSTGACVATVCLAAWKALQAVPLSEQGHDMSVLFPDGQQRVLTVQCRTWQGIPPVGEARIIKDGGDDPDCTHGAAVYARLRRLDKAEWIANPSAHDYVLEVGAGVVVVRAVEGIGLCTRPGLDCEPGKWAINAVPRRMIVDNLTQGGLKAGYWLAEVGIAGGEALARKTLNKHLGIEGGLSVLGTTGLVRPFSHEAYVETIRLCVGSHKLMHGTQSGVVFCTGGRTKAGARAVFPQLPESAFVFMGDFLAESLAAACAAGMERLVVACMAGKLCKYAAGFDNTHAHAVPQDMALLCAQVRELWPQRATLHTTLEHKVSVREALLTIPAADHPALLRRLADLALTQFTRRVRATLGPGASSEVPDLNLLVFDFNGVLLLDFNGVLAPDVDDERGGNGSPRTLST